MRNLSLALVGAMALVAIERAKATDIVDIGDGTTVDLVASGYNGHTGGTSSEISTAAYRLRLGTGVTVKLDAASAVDGVFSLYANISASSGGFTLDATGIDTVRWIGGVQTSGQVLIKGAKSVMFGEEYVYANKISTSYFDTDMVFEAVDATGVTFVNTLTLAKMPSCPHAIGAGTRVALYGDGLLGDGADVYTFDAFSVDLIGPRGFNAGKVVVAGGQTLNVRQCSVSDKNGGWSWAGASNRHLTNDFECAIQSTISVKGAGKNIYFDGKVSGAGRSSLMTVASDGVFLSELDFPGIVRLDGGGYLSCSGAGPFAFYDLETTSDDAGLTLGGGCSISINVLGYWSGAGVLAVSGPASASVEVAGTVDDHVTVQIDGAVKVGFGGTAHVALVGEGPWAVMGPESGTTPAELTLTAPESGDRIISLGGLLKLGDLGGTFTAVTLLPGTKLFETTFGPSTALSGNGQFVTTPWMDKVALWTDASQTNTFGYVGDLYAAWELTDKSIYEGRPLVVEWRDCRADHDVYRFRQTRYKNTTVVGSISASVYPMDDGSAFPLNGSHTLSMWSKNQTNARRFSIAKSSAVNTSVNLDTAYAIMVFGSQSGGGKALLATTDGYFARPYGCDPSNQGDGANGAICTDASVTVHVDGGVEQSASAIGMNGGWQIISMDTANKPISGIGVDSMSGYDVTSGTPGYQRYAEVMLFSEKPTETERKVAEEYLAAKWNLPCAHTGTVIAETRTFSLGSVISDVAVLDYGNDGLPRTLTVNVAFTAKPAVGRHPLVSGVLLSSCTLASVTGAGSRSVSLEYDAQARTLYAKVEPKGMMLLFR